MKGSGLADIWERVYSKGSVVHMLTGHAFSRAVRAYILTLPALLDDADWESNIDKDSVTSLYQDKVKQDQHPDTVDNESLHHFEQLLVHDVDKAVMGSRTGKLWVQYVHQVLLMLKFITAERTGNWQLHLHCVEEMIPHFHAAGHLQYVKSARLYLQQMNNIVLVMPPEQTKDILPYAEPMIFGLATFLTRPLSSTL